MYCVHRKPCSSGDEIRQMYDHGNALRDSVGCAVRIRNSLFTFHNPYINQRGFSVKIYQGENDTFRSYDTSILLHSTLLRV
jgi:hypothetical protein